MFVDVESYGGKEVLDNLYKKKRIRGREPEDAQLFRTLGYLGPGAMRGVEGGAIMTAAHDAGLIPTFDVLVGNSCGAPTVVYGASGQAHQGTSIFYDECCHRGFKRAMTLDTKLLTSWFLEGPKALHEDKAHTAHPDLFACVTSADTGEGELLNVKTADVGMVRATSASYALPGSTLGEVTVNGRQYLDGVGGCPLPLKEMVERFEPTDMVVVMNSPGPMDTSLWASLPWHFMTRRLSKAAREAFLSFGTRFNDSLAWFAKEKPCRALFIWGSKDLDILEVNSRVLFEKVQRAYLNFSPHLQRAGSLVSVR